MDAAAAGLTAASLVASLRRAGQLQAAAEQGATAAAAKHNAPSRHLVSALGQALGRALRERSQERPNAAVVDALLAWSQLGWRLPHKVGQAASSAVLHLAPHLDGIPLLRLAAAYALGRAHHTGTWQLGPKAAVALQAALERQLPRAGPRGVAFLLAAGPWLLPPEQLAHPPEALEAALQRTAPHMSVQEATAARAAAGSWRLNAAAVDALQHRIILN